VKYGNIIKISTENVSHFSIFPPVYYLDPAHELTIIINGIVSYEGMTDGVTQLVCKSTESDSGYSWQVESDVPEKIEEE
jgi:hypothetical protein